MRLCNFRIPEECLVWYQTSQHNWMTIKMLYRYLLRFLLGWHRTRLGFVIPSIGDVSLGPLGNAQHYKPWKQGDYYLLSMRWFSHEEETVMQQSSVNISLNFWEPRYQSSRRVHANRLVPAQTNENLATNAIKGSSIPSRPLAKVRSDKDNKINIFGIFMI